MSSDSDYETNYGGATDTQDEWKDVEFGQQLIFPSQEENNNLARISELEAENKKLQEENLHIKWHIGVYHTALEKFSHLLPVYQETFREFRESPECPECKNARLLQEISVLKCTIAELYSKRALSERRNITKDQ